MRGSFKNWGEKMTGLRPLIAIALTFASCEQVSAQSPVSAIGTFLGEHIIDVVSNHVGDIVIWIKNRNDVSVGKLIIDLAALSGMENSLADSIDLIGNNSNPNLRYNSSAVTADLNQRLATIYEALEAVKSDLQNIDQGWAGKGNNVMVNIDLGKFAQDSNIYYCKLSCSGAGGGAGYSGGGIQITDRVGAQEISGALHKDVMTIRKLALELHNAAITNAGSAPSAASGSGN
jgi:hypothetical protein